MQNAKKRKRGRRPSHNQFTQVLEKLNQLRSIKVPKISLDQGGGSVDIDRFCDVCYSISFMDDI